MNLYSKLRRNIIEENGVYKVKDLFGDIIKEGVFEPEIDNPRFYDIQTRTIKLGALCAEEIKNSTKPEIEMDGVLYTTYCALTHISNSLDGSLVNKFHYNIDKIYDYLRRDLKIDNRKKFHGLMKTILSYTDPANTLNIIVEFIERKSNNPSISLALKKFRHAKDINEKDIEEFLLRVKSTGHKEYEESFYDNHFKKKTTKLTLKYKTYEDNKSIVQRIKDVLRGVYDVSQAVSILYENIINNYTPDEMIKADLICVNDVTDSSGNVIINSGDYLEVKKIDTGLDSYLSEFMSIYKNESLPKYAHKKQFKNIYNQIIDGLFILLNQNDNILKDINFVGIIYDDRIFVGRNDIELYWSNRGQRSCTSEHRLSIRYRVKDSVVDTYTYVNGYLEKNDRPIKVSTREKEYCPITKSV
jgi:hypothetical protein